MPRRVLVLMTVALLLSGCILGEPSPPTLWVRNASQETLIGEPQDHHERPATIPPGVAVPFGGQPPGCESMPWVAKNTSGEVVAEIPGACAGHNWTIKGPDDYIYE